MVPELKLAAWLTAGLALYRSHPLLTESVFYAADQTGAPSQRGPGVFADQEKAWLPNEYAGGLLRWAGATFPIVSNTATVLTVTGDPSLVEPTDVPCYQIVPKLAQDLAQLLATGTVQVSTSFAQVPTVTPAITIRLEKDTQAETYVGESLHMVGEAGVEYDIRTQHLTGAYLLSIWTANREACLWLYAWLLHYALLSMPQFTSWGLSDVSLSGSDLDPMLQYLAERTYSRHLLFTCTRIERAVWATPVEWISDFAVQVLAHYATFVEVVPQRFG